ncbi:hypothetical protein ACFOU0_12405 [Salinicoccus sesuvii]|uniref:Uncharacterized protein n=1 Tax=Salinicoccus sesuvii TaxID=868281 RepID=A0ABV7N725_9STAP
MLKRKSLKSHSNQALADELKRRTGAEKLLIAGGPEDNIYGPVSDAFDFFGQQVSKDRSKEDLELQSTLLQQLIKEMDS